MALFVRLLKKHPYIFHDCIYVKSLWEKLITKFQNDIILPSFTPQAAAILGLTNEANNIFNLLNHILLIFKYYVYRSREKHIFNIYILIDNIIEIKKKEKQISLASKNKWCMVHYGALQMMHYT